MAEGSESSGHCGAHGAIHRSELLTPWRAERSAKTELPEGQLYSLNSARLKRQHLKLTAEALGLPVGAGAEETRQLVEGHLISIGKEPGLVQVLVQDSRRVTQKLRLYLVDQAGVFAEAGSTEECPRESGASSSELEEMRSQLTNTHAQLDELQRQLHTIVDSHQAELQMERDRVKQLWKQMCDRVQKLDSALAEKDEIIEELNQQLAGATRDPSQERVRVRDAEEHAASRNLQLPREDPQDSVYPPPSEYSLSPSCSLLSIPNALDAQLHTSHFAGRRQRERQTSDRIGGQQREQQTTSTHRRRGKAPPVEQFTGENPEELLDDWLPTLERAGEWNGWSRDELLMQMAGHLRSRALQEWNLLSREEKSDWDTAVVSLKSRLEPRDRALAAQDFRHATQKKSESVADYIRRIERAFQLAYGRDAMSRETRAMILFTQLQEGLLYRLLESPAVSGAKSYTELNLAAKNEEKRQIELEKRREYSRGFRPMDTNGYKFKTPTKTPTLPQPSAPNPGKPTPGPRRCYNCGDPGHLAKNCLKPPTESKGSHQKPRNRGVHSRQENTAPPTSDSAHSDPPSSSTHTDPLSFLFSDESDPERCCQVDVKDQGSHTVCVPLQVEGVPAYGLVDTGADITIIGPRLFKKVAAVSRLKKKDFKPADKTPHGYDGRPFELHGRMQLTLSFDGQEMKTMVYIKMDVEDQLLLSEGVCRQLGIVKYHPNIEVWRGRKKRKKPKKLKEPKVPRVSCTVKLVKTVHLAPHSSSVVTIQSQLPSTCILLEPLSSSQSDSQLLSLLESPALVKTDSQGVAHVVLSNLRKTPQKCQQGDELAIAVSADVIEPAADHAVPLPRSPAVREISTSDRMTKLFSLLPKEEISLSTSEHKQLHQCLEEHHSVFAVEENERGHTDLVEMEIFTGDAPPSKQHLRRVPFGVRKEVARQLQKMQEMDVIQPSNSPWSSPIVLVRKKDGTLRFCIDYRHLNSITKTDTYPLPRVDDIIDQLGPTTKYFSTLDLASGYWQIPMDPSSQEKTAFITIGGLFEFKVMPFGLKNAPAVFQRLMEKILQQLNPVDGRKFVSVYVDDVLVFSSSFQEHVEHVTQVFKALQKAGLKLKPSKCRLFRKEVEYLGYLLTPDGLLPNQSQTEAVVNFPVPTSLHELRQFVGLASYYRRFIKGFATIAQPLHCLTRKGAKFVWDTACQDAFQSLKDKLVSHPVLSYPNFDKDFILETDASARGLGAVLNQEQSDGTLHPVAYASRAVSQSEANYAVTDLETLAVVWAFTHFRAYLYGHHVTVYTDHAAVKATLGVPHLNGKHARWWTKIYGSGIRSVEIRHRSGKQNTNADALSRNPYLPPPVKEIDTETQVATVTSQQDGSQELADIMVDELLQLPPTEPQLPDNLRNEQMKEPKLSSLFNYLEDDRVPSDSRDAQRVVAEAQMFAVMDGVLYYVDPKRRNRKRAVVPPQLRESIIREYHGGPMAGHFSTQRLYSTMARSWWWKGMYTDVHHHCQNCPQCAFVSNPRHSKHPFLHPIPVGRPFQIVGVDIMDLPKTKRGNQHVVVFQDFLTKWPLVFPVPDQKSLRIVKLLVEELVPLFGVPEALLSDRGTNLLSHLMMDVCQMLGTKKLNTTSYHPQCDGMVERFNRTLKSMLRKHAATHGNQWDQYLSGVLWAYRNTPHEATREKPSFLLFGVDCRSPTEAAYLPTTVSPAVPVCDYREELIRSLSSAREIACQSIREAQQRYKSQYDEHSQPVSYKLGDWVLVRFPQDESGRLRKLSRPWHGPYRVISIDDPDIILSKIYYPQHDPIKVHQSRVKHCPPDLSAGLFWYGSRRSGPGRPPKWTEKLVRPDTDAEELEVQPNTASDSSDANTSSRHQTTHYDLRPRK